MIVRTEWQSQDDEDVMTEDFSERSLADIAQSLELLYGPLQYLRLEVVAEEDALAGLRLI